jgi:acetyl-CoA synthetase
MRQVKDPRSRYKFNMRSIGSGGETLGEELLQWGKAVFDLTINEFYGQTEVNLVVSNCSEIMDNLPGAMGKSVPGHTLAIVDASGRPLSTVTVGEVAIKRPDPVMFLEYWKDPKATEDKYAGDWCLTGDLAKQDDRGYFWFVGRKDDVITSAGYRIGPAEIEDCIMKHFVKLRLAAHEYPREIEFVNELPMTATGKIKRKDLKALEIKRKAK